MIHFNSFRLISNALTSYSAKINKNLINESEKYVLVWQLKEENRNN